MGFLLLGADVQLCPLLLQAAVQGLIPAPGVFSVFQPGHGGGAACDGKSMGENPLPGLTVGWEQGRLSWPRAGAAWGPLNGFGAAWGPPEWIWGCLIPSTQSGAP